jgi:hypothetical protein
MISISNNGNKRFEHLIKARGVMRELLVAI